MRVVAAAVIDKGKILLARRKSGRLKGFWEFPGGKIEANETDAVALRRELLEELGLKSEIGPYIGSFPYADDSIELVLVLYWAFSRGNVGHLIDHDEVKWVSPELLTTEGMARADIEPAKALKNWLVKSGLPKG